MLSPLAPTLQSNKIIILDKYRVYIPLINSVKILILQSEPKVYF